MDEQEFSTEETIKELEAIKIAMINDVTSYARRIDEIIKNLKRKQNETDYKQD